VGMVLWLESNANAAYRRLANTIPLPASPLKGEGQSAAAALRLLPTTKGTP